MKSRAIESADGPGAPNYAQALEVTGASRFLFISGQVPVTRDGAVPEGFDAQARQVWANIDAQLGSAGMTAANLVKVTTFLSDRRFAEPNRLAREAYVAGHLPALTVILCDIFDSGWLLEIEAIAAD